MSRNKSEIENEKAWLRQCGEGDKAFEAFQLYLNMGTDRSIRAVAQKLNKSSTQIGKWSSAWKWTERVRAYENELQKEAQAKAVKDHKDMVERHILISMQLQNKALEALTALKSKTLSPRDIREFIKLATDLERLNRTIEEESDKSKGGNFVSLTDKDTRIDIYIPEKDKDSNE